MTRNDSLRIALLVNSMRSVDDRITAPHMEVIRGIRTGLINLGHRADIHGVSDGDTPTRSIVKSLWPEVKSDLETQVQGQSKTAHQEMGRILEGLAFARETSHCVHAVRQAEKNADILHMHWAGHLFGALISRIPVVYTQHYGYDDPDFFLTIKEKVFSELPGIENVHWVMLSRPQVKFLPDRLPKDHIHVVPHGLDFRPFPSSPGKKEEYVAFLGRIMRIKAPHLAIDAARMAGIPIRLAGPVDPVKEGEPEYFEDEIKPRLGPGVEYLGELGFDEKIRLLHGARALINPFQLEEPFGLVMIEALACGTPLIVPKQGAALDFVREGENGYFARTTEEMAAAVEKCRSIDSRTIQADVRHRFSREKMIQGYVQVYQKALDLHGTTDRGEGR